MKKTKLLSVLGITVLATFQLFNLPKASAATYTVINTNNSGAGSLRQAITDANNNAGLDTINFNIPTDCPKITLSSTLPPVNAGFASPINIDASSQACTTGPAEAPNVEISGQNLGAGAIGIHITGNGNGSTIRGLIINRFSAQGIWIDTSNVTVVGNYIGVDVSGTVDLGNAGDGIAIFSGTPAASANNNIIGGTTAADRNVISGNTGNGIGITSQNGGNANNNSILGNYIGTNKDGTGAIANTGDGILINYAGGTAASAINNIIGGTIGTTPGGACTGACNLVSGNTANGIGLWHGGVSGSQVYGNYVGTNLAGTGAIPNGDIGIEVNETANNTVGGTTPAARNVFSGNRGAGVFLTGSSATGNAIQGNYIGTNAAGTSGVGNTKMGVGVGASPGAVGANSNVIGGTNGTTPGIACTGACNLISGNGENGIFMAGSESFGQQILGNYIGSNALGTAGIGNVADGIGIISVPNTSIGNGTNAGQNRIGANGSNGIIIVGGAATGNRIDTNVVGYPGLGNTASGVVVSSATDTAILRNSIHGNGKLGIDLDNNGTVNINDANDNDSGANRLQNYPVVYAANTKLGDTKIGGQFNGTPNSSFQIDFFYSDGCNAGYPNNFGEGQNYISSISINTDGFGNTAFGTTTPSQIAGNKYITATATKKINGIAAETSEFSQCVLVNAAKPALTNGATWFLKYDLTTGPGDKNFGYGFPSTLLMCAWDPNQPGVKLPTIYYNGSWFMRASYTTGAADLSFTYGDGSQQAVCGDWDGDGVDTVGVVSGNNTWQLRNSNSGGAPNSGNFQFGSFPSRPVVGDWDGDGIDTIGTVDSSNNWSQRNSNSAGPADNNFNYGFTPSYPVVGDWDGNGTDTIGSVSIGGTWSVRSNNSSGAPNGSFQFGFPGTVPVLW